MSDELSRESAHAEEVRRLRRVAETAEALLGYHDRCGVQSSYGDALRAALAAAEKGGDRE